SRTTTSPPLTSAPQRSAAAALSNRASRGVCASSGTVTHSTCCSAITLNLYPVVYSPVSYRLSHADGRIHDRRFYQFQYRFLRVQSFQQDGFPIFIHVDDRLADLLRVIYLRVFS